MEKHYHCLQKKCEELLQAPHNFSAKNMSAIDSVSTVIRHKSSTNEFVKETHLSYLNPEKRYNYVTMSRFRTLGQIPILGTPESPILLSPSVNM